MKIEQLNQIKNQNIKRFLAVLVIIIILLAITAGLRLTVFKPAPKQIYEVAIQVRSQQSSDPVEDRKNSLKAGDVLLAVDEGHRWSNTEQISYLILKMELSEEEKAKLTSPEEKEIKFKDLSKEEQERIEEERKRTKEAGEEYAEEPRRETARMREYYIPLDQKAFEGFAAVDLLRGQPYSDKIYDWGVVEKKAKVK